MRSITGSSDASMTERPIALPPEGQRDAQVVAFQKMSVRSGAVVDARAERLASLLPLSYEPMLVWELDGPIEVWNTGAERLYGFTPEEAMGCSNHALLQTPGRIYRVNYAASN